MATATISAFCGWNTPDVQLRSVLLVMVVLVFFTARAVISHAGDEGRNIEKYSIKRVEPSYPPSAQQFRIEGAVTVVVSVGGNGKVSKAEFVRGNNVFWSVSLDAAKRWQFKLPDNNAEGTIRFVFKLRLKRPVDHPGKHR